MKGKDASESCCFSNNVDAAEMDGGGFDDDKISWKLKQIVGI